MVGWDCVVVVSRGSRRLALLVKMGKVGGGGEEREKDVEIDLEDVYRENQVEWNTARNTREREREYVCIYICVCICVCVIYSFLSNRNQSSEPTHQPPPPTPPQKKKNQLWISSSFFIYPKTSNPFSPEKKNPQPSNPPYRPLDLENRGLVYQSRCQLSGAEV